MPIAVTVLAVVAVLSELSGAIMFNPGAIASAGRKGAISSAGLALISLGFVCSALIVLTPQ